MRDIFTVFRFTLRDGVRKKAFIITTIVVLVLIVAACAVPGILGTGKDTQPGPSEPGEVKQDTTCYVIDADNAVPGGMEALTAAFPDVAFKAGTPDQLPAYKEEAKADQSVAVVEVAPAATAGTLPTLRYYAHSFMDGFPISDVAAVLKTTYVSRVLGDAGISADMTQLALSDMTYQMELVGKMDLSGYILGIVLTMIIFFAVYYYGYGVAMSVATEKTSRVMETLVVSAKPSRILLGKCLGMGVLGLFQLTLFLAVGALGFTFLIPEGFTIAGMPLALSAFTLPSALLVLLYFILGYALYAVLNSVCGATVSRTEDLNAAMMPTVLVSLISFYAAYIVMFVPNDAIKRVVTYIPFTSPFIMPFRLLNETVPATDILISVALLLVGIVLIAWASIRIYTASVLHYGQRLRLKDLFSLRA